MATKRNYPPLICNRCGEVRNIHTKCERNGCDFEEYRNAVWEHYRLYPPAKYYISVTGGVNAGKTSYLLALADTLMNDKKIKEELRKYGIKEILMIDPISQRYFRGSINEYKLGRLQMNSPNGPLCFFSLFINTMDGQAREFIFFNVAGENFEDAIMDTDFKYYRKFHELLGVAQIVLIDPREDFGLNRLLKMPKSPEFGHEKDMSPFSFLSKMYQYLNMGSKSINNPIAICVSKFDLLDNLFSNENSQPYVRDSSEYVFKEINQMSDMLSNFLLQNSIVADPGEIKQLFENHKFFAVAPYGSDRQPAFWDQRDPKGILAPFLWILKELNILPAQ